MPIPSKKAKKGKKAKNASRKATSIPANVSDTFTPDLDSPHYFWEQFIDLVPDRDLAGRLRRLKRGSEYSFESDEDEPHIFSQEEKDMARVPEDVTKILKSTIKITQFPFTDDDLEAMRLQRLEEVRREEEKKKAEIEQKKARKLKAKQSKLKGKDEKKKDEELPEGDQITEVGSTPAMESEKDLTAHVHEDEIEQEKRDEPTPKRVSISKRDMKTLSSLAHNLAQLWPETTEPLIRARKDSKIIVESKSVESLVEAAASPPEETPQEALDEFTEEEKTPYNVILGTLKEFLVQQPIQIKYLPDIEQKSTLQLSTARSMEVEVGGSQYFESDEFLAATKGQIDRDLIIKLKAYRKDVVSDFALLNCAFDVLQTMNEWMRESASSNDPVQAPIVTMTFLWACRMFMDYLENVLNTSSYDALHPVSVTHMHVYSALGGGGQSGVGYKLTQYLLDNHILSSLEFDWSFFASLSIGCRSSDMQDEFGKDDDVDQYEAMSQALIPIVTILNYKVEEIIEYAHSLEADNIGNPGDERRRRRPVPTNPTGVPRPRIPLHSLRCYAMKFVGLVMQRVARDLAFACHHQGSEESMYHGVPLTEAMSLNLLWELNAAVQKIH